MRPVESRFADNAHSVLFDHLVRWSTAHCTCPTGPGEHIGQSFAAATFSAFCAPPHASDEQALVAAKCCLLFFLVDDGPAERLDDLVRFLDTGEGAVGNEAAACWTSLLADLDKLGCDVDDLVPALRAWADSTRREQDVDVRTLTPEGYHALRKDTIFVSCLVFCWLSLLGARVPETASEDLLDLAIRVVVLANDLGSLRADGTPPDSPDALVDINTVVLAHDGTGSVEEAVHQAVLDHNALVLRFRAAERDLVEHAGPDDERTSAFLSVVRHVVNGNLRGTRYLTAERYPGSAETLGRLDLV
ncbi:hypothetical protein ACFFQW_42510 [Umezawaea endophytica]|uniref:Terpene synthase n=1 Tax=Umezawaea endophytica TaxID=1654476 RepID=A0A9X2VKX4_9PSEU|nr:hypothetical protein [Umezawaea endophytica]MCS7477937.1 hypothetical protein [Umezawaea endophytica]